MQGDILYFHDILYFNERSRADRFVFFVVPCFPSTYFNPKQAGGGGGIRPQVASSLFCAETVSGRKLKLCDFYHMRIGFHFEYISVPWDIHCCHGNAIVEECLVSFCLKLVENCKFLLKSFLISI